MVISLKKIIGASHRHSELEVHKYDCTPHNGNLYSPPRRADARSAAFAEQK
ncbi:MAG: hypothetical protein SOS24_03735 [Clostridia bacterium]|nr:hypothetical protein [Clostridia bacterium]